MSYLQRLSARRENILSEIARLKQQIELETSAMRLAMTGFRNSASHEIINGQMDRLGQQYEQLKGLIGEQAAIETVIAALGREESCQ
jgi:prefoldin subunit 5